MSSGGSPASRAVGRPAPWAPWVAGALIALAASVVHWMLNPEPLLHGMSDEALLVPLGLKTVGAASYANDTWLDLAGQVFSVPYSYLVGWVTQGADDPVGGLRLLALPFMAIFLGGVWLLARRQSGSNTAALAAVAVLVLPVLLTEVAIYDTLAPFVPQTHSRLEQLTLAPGAALPRDLVFALFPLLWMAGWWAWAKGALHVGLVLACFGLLANLHPITALHGAGLLLLCGLMEKRSAAGAQRFVVGVAAFLLGAAPFVLQYLAYPVTPGEVPAELLAWRVDGIGGESWTRWAGRMEPFCWMGLAALLLLRTVDVERSLGETRLLRGAVVATLLAAFAPFVTNAVPLLQGFQPDRLGRFAALLLVVLCSRLAWLAWRSGSRFSVGAATALFVLILLNPVLVRLAVGGPGTRGPVEELARRLERTAGRGAGAVTRLPTGLIERSTPGDPAVPRDPAASADFRAICAHARAETAPDALFLVPPESFGAFRVYARRASSVTRKSGGFSLSFLGGHGNDWYAAYVLSLKAFAGGDEPSWRALAESTGAHYVVCDPVAEPPAAWPVVKSTATYELRRITR